MAKMGANVRGTEYCTERLPTIGCQPFHSKFYPNGHTPPCERVAIF